jgi:hypothetical protein
LKISFRNRIKKFLHKIYCWKKKRFENFNISKNNIIGVQANVISAELEKILECFVFQEGKKNTT